MQEKDKISEWMNNSPGALGKVIALAITVFSMCLVIGAIKDWKWLYKADGHYQNSWSMGQISRYLGRNTARVIGFISGLAFLVLGTLLLYAAFFKYDG